MIDPDTMSVAKVRELLLAAARAKRNAEVDAANRALEHAETEIAAGKWDNHAIPPSRADGVRHG